MRKKLIAILCILSMCMSLVTPAMAQDAQTPEETAAIEEVVENDEEVAEGTVQDATGDLQEKNAQETNEIVQSEDAQETKVAKEQEKEETSENKIYSASSYWINPIYEDVISESDLISNYGISVASSVETESVSDEEYTTSTEVAAESLRKGLVNREAEITVYYQALAENVPLDDSDAFNAWFSTLGEEILNYAKEHTKVPNEGDSLSFVLGASCIIQI